MDFQNSKWIAGALFALALTGCSKATEEVDVFLPRPDDPYAGAKAAVCSPEKVSLASFDKNKKFLESAEFRSFFDCANYDNKFAGIAPLVHSPASPRFLESLMDSVGSIASSEHTKSIKERLAPWFEEHKGSGVSKIDHMLPVVAKVIKHSAFRKALPLLASIASEGKGVWRTLLPPLAKFVYDPRYPNLWQDMRKLFNVKSTSSDLNHLAITTREFFKFLRQENADPSGVRKTNALLTLELLNELEEFKVPKSGLLSLWEYMHNRDIWTTLYQEAGGAIRGEETLPDLNGGKGAGEAAIQASMRRKVDQLFQGGAKSAMIDLLALCVDFNQKRPEFFTQISNWLGKPANQKRMHTGLVEFVGRRLVGEILNSLQLSQYFETYVRKVLKRKIPVQVTNADGSVGADVCTDGVDCELTAEEFAGFVRGALAHKEFETWLTKVLNDKNKDKFREQNAQLLERHGGLQRDLLAFYRAEAVSTYAGALVANSPAKKLALNTAFDLFSQAHKLEKGASQDGAAGLITALDGKTKLAYDHLIDIWMKNSAEAWGESIVLQDGFRILHTFVETMANESANDPDAPTIAQSFFRATYSDPSMMERLVFEGKRLKLLDNLPDKMAWLSGEIGPEIFRNESDLAAFRRVVAQLPNLILYVESGMLRSGNNLMRAISERDQGYLTRTYVDFITRAYALGTAQKFIPLWKDFIDFMDVREQRVKKAVAEAHAKMSPDELETEALREARRQADGTTALKKIGQALLRPRVEKDWNTSLAGEILVATRGLVSEARRAETEEWILTIADRTITADDKDIDAFYEFFSGDEGNIVLTGLETEADVKADHEFRKNVADLLSHKSFPDVLVDLDLLFQDKAVVPALDFFAAKIDEGDIARLLELARKLLGIQGMKK